MNPEAQQPILAARDIRRSFRLGHRTIEVLRGIDLDVHPGETVFVCGKSGAGKSTLLYTVAGLERPDAGEVVFDGRSLYRLGEGAMAHIRNNDFGFVFQNYSLLPELTALENVVLPSLIAGRDTEDRAADALERVGLADRRTHLPAELSGGEQQRVAIARALANNPRILFADEPTGNLDAATGSAVFDLLLALASEERRTLLVVTHDTDLARRGDRMLEIREGVIAN
jgi:putative ABC transport system ATP-binding protein/lipoprotein-releasing system ATP-binding protein